MKLSLPNIFVFTLSSPFPHLFQLQLKIRCERNFSNCIETPFYFTIIFRFSNNTNSISTNEVRTPTAEETTDNGILMNDLNIIPGCSASDQMEEHLHNEKARNNKTSEKEHVTTNEGPKEEKTDIDYETDNLVIEDAHKCVKEIPKSKEREGKGDPAGGDRILLNSNPEYRLNPSMLLYYALLFNCDNLMIVLLRRFLFFYAMWAMIGYLAFVVFNFYNSVLDDLSFVSWQAEVLNSLLQSVFKGEYESFIHSDPDSSYGIKSMYAVVVYVPIAMSLLQMSLLYSVFLSPRDICSTLYWGCDEKILDVNLAQQFSETVRDLVDKSPQRLLFERMKFRFTLIFNKDFWFSMWKQLQIQSNNSGNKKHYGSIYRKLNPKMFRGRGNQFKRDKTGHDELDPDQASLPVVEHQSSDIGSCCVLFFKAVIVYPIIALLASFPIFSMWTNVFVNPTQLTVPSCRRKTKSNRMPSTSGGVNKLEEENGEKKEKCSQSPILWLTMPVSCVGIALFILALLDFSALYSQALLFLFIDVFRNSDALLSKCIFGISILLYIHSAFIRFEDSYRSIKMTVFEICQNINAEYVERENCLVCLPNTDGVDCETNGGRPVPLVVDSKDGQISIPRQLFIDICEKYAPYKSRVFWCFLELFISLTVIIFLFLVAVAFQVFAEFSAFGESMFTLATMSVPYIFGGFLKSEVYVSLKKARLDKEMEALIRGCVTKIPQTA